MIRTPFRSTLRPLALAAALALGATATMTASAQNAPHMMTTDGTLLSVSAQAEAKRVPDIATVSTGVVTQAADANSAMRANAEQMAKVIAAIKAAGVPERDIQTAPVRILLALIMTGLGLAVAIPSAVAYNVFVRLNRNTLVSLNSFAHDVFAFLATGLSTGPLLSDVERTSDRVIYRFQQSSGQTREVK